MSQPLRARVRITVRDGAHLAATYAANLAARGMFIAHAAPPPIDSGVEILFRVADGSTLSRVVGRVVHARPALTPGDPTAGMGIELEELDDAAREIVQAFKASGGQAAAAPVASADLRIEALGPEGAPSGREGLVLGIDLGTTYCCVAYIVGGEVKLVSHEGRETFPSVIFVEPDQKVVVGDKAIERMVLNPGRGIFGSKRFIGRPFASREVGTYGHFFNYRLAEGNHGMAVAQIEGMLVPLDIVAAYILSHIKQLAVAALGPVERAVITVPAYFGESQRAAVRRAGEMAGLVVERILSEPTAAAVAFGHGRGLRKTILVYDLGGGTFDATVLRVEGDRMEVLATDGDPFLGGADFDDRLTEYVLMTLERQHGAAMQRDPVTVQRVRLAAEKAKRDLTDAETAQVQVPHIAPGVHASVTIPRTLFRSLTEDLAVRTLTIVQRVLDAAQLTSAQLDDVILVGGQSRSPMIRELLRERFGREPTRHVHPDHAVAIGAAWVGAALGAQTPLELTDVLPASLRLTKPGDVTELLFARGTKLPIDKELTIPSEHGDDGPRFRISLCSGEGERASENMPLGEVQLPSTLALAFAKTPATVRVAVSADGLLQLSARHPITGELRELAVSLADDPDEGEYLEIDEADLVAM